MRGARERASTRSISCTSTADDLRPLALIERRALLRKHLKRAGAALIYSDGLTGADGEAMFRHACRMGLEGIVSKRVVEGQVERDDETLLAGFNDEQNDVALFIGWTDYARATGTMPIEAQVHQAWYLAKNPSKLNPKHSPEPYQRLFPNIAMSCRRDQKKLLHEKIEWARCNVEMMKHPQTDPRPLILPWPTQVVP